MKSIKEKLRHMSYLAQGKLLRRCHARAAGIFVEDQHSAHLKVKKSRRPSK